MGRLKSLICDEDGAELLEFALAATMFTMMLFGIIQFSQGVYAANMVGTAAQMGSRYAMVRGSSWGGTANLCATINSQACSTATDGSGVKAYILSLPHPGSGFTGANNQIQVIPLATAVDSTGCTPWARGCRIEVRISYTIGVNLPIFPPNWNPLSMTLHGDSIETIQN